MCDSKTANPVSVTPVREKAFRGLHGWRIDKRRNQIRGKACLGGRPKPLLNGTAAASALGEPGHAE